jgi:putative ABC transport system substrate-binding protein
LGLILADESEAGGPVTSRRAFITTLALGALPAPARAEAHQVAKTWRLGFLGGGSAAGYARHVEALRLGLRDNGYVEGRNLTIEFRWADGRYDRLQTLARDLVRLDVDVIITQGTPAALVAKQTTTTIPIVMAIVGNPVETGIVASLARPGGNVTGSSFFYAELNAKRLEFIKLASPGLTRVAVLLNPDNSAMASVLNQMEGSARSLKLTLWRTPVRALDELDAALAVAKAQTEALTVIDEGLFIANAKRVADLALRLRMPSIGFSEYCEAGGLLGYGVDFPRIWRNSMNLVDRILKGAKPAELPIQQATSFELMINAKTATALGLTLPPSVLARADKVIE